MQDGRRLEMFSCSRCTREDENARADDGADAQRRQRPGAKLLFKPVARSVGVSDQLVDGLAAEKLILRGVADDPAGSVDVCVNETSSRAGGRAAST